MGEIDQAFSEARRAEALLAEIFRHRPEYAAKEYGCALEVVSRCQYERKNTPEVIATLERAIQLIGPHFERRPAELRVVMQKVVDNFDLLRSPALSWMPLPHFIQKMLSGYVTHKTTKAAIPAHILDLLESGTR